MKQHGLAFDPVPVVEELLRSPEQPRSVLSCLSACVESVARISGSDGPQVRMLGRLCSQLEYGDLADPSGPAVIAEMHALLSGIYEIGDAIRHAYFSSQALLATLGAQEGQQQQCG